MTETNQYANKVRDSGPSLSRLKYEIDLVTLQKVQPSAQFQPKPIHESPSRAKTHQRPLVLARHHL
jgi:hypothetical protein